MPLQESALPHTFLCSAERTSTSVVAELLLLPNKTNPALSHTEIADGVLKSLHVVLYTENDNVLSYHKSFSNFMFDQNRAKKFWCDKRNTIDSLLTPASVSWTARNSISQH